MNAPGPLIPGFNPDPSIVLVDGWYYLVTSTFEYLPGIPVYRSADLVDWEQVGNVITRAEQLDLRGVPTPGGVWAPTIRHRDGVFHVIVTVMFAPQGCVVFTADDPAGPWSDGTRIGVVDGIDPDLVWDDDGTALVTFAAIGRGIQQVAVDLGTGEALEPVRPLWSGSGLYAPEGPHIHHHKGLWYLLVAEGGTDRGHAVSVARGPSPRGPFTGNPANPVLSARSTGFPVQNLGHADLVETPDGGTAAVLLGVRPVGFIATFSPLGRETFLAPVEWVDGWLRARMPRPASEPSAGSFSVDFRDPGAELDHGWIASRRFPDEVASLSAVPGVLTIVGTQDGLRDPAPAFVGRRQTHLSATVSTRLAPSAGVGGLAARHSEVHWFSIEAQRVDSATQITARASLAGFEHVWQDTLPGDEVELRIESVSPTVELTGAPILGGDRIRLIAADQSGEVVLAELDGRYWSHETTQTFTGRVVGMFAAEGQVGFLDFRYEGWDGTAEPS